MISPAQWTLETAHAWTRHVCERTAGDGVPPGRLIPNYGQPLAPTSKARLIFGMRSFFRDILDWEWLERRFNPFHAFKLPKQIRRAVGPNPRPIDDAVWLKLRAAALSLAHRTFGQEQEAGPRCCLPDGSGDRGCLDV